ncbi:MAG: cytochrome c biogenesis CcdA family protein [Halodesulfurarchaeum sp.]
MSGVPGFVAVFGAGVLTILSPCVFPLMPAVVSSGAGHRLRPVALVGGSIVSFTIMGITVGAVASLSPQTFRLPMVALLIVFGAVLVDEDLNEVYERYASRVSRRTDRFTTGLTGENSLIGGFVTGTLLGIVWLPCVGPILGGVLAFAGQSGSVLSSGSLLLVYGLGFSIPLLITAYLGMDAMRRAGIAIGRRGGRKLVGAVLLLTGVSLLFDLDKLVMRWFIELSIV